MKTNPFLKTYGNVKFNLEYPKGSMSRVVLDTAQRKPDSIALSFMGKKTTYEKLSQKIDLAAKALASLGVKKKDVVTICMPNAPQAIYCLYAINRIGAVASMIHPLSSVNEIAFFVNEAKSKFVLTLDQFYKKFEEIEDKIKVKKIILTKISSELGYVKSAAFKLLNKKIKIKPNEKVVFWKDFIAGGKNYSGKYIFEAKDKDLAIILFSGGTTGVTKGIKLSNLNLNALALQTKEMCQKQVEDKKMLAAMPIFHGFGLGVCIHSMMVSGGQSILVPKFNVKEYAKLIKKNRPNFIAGVPTLYEALTRKEYLKNVKLDCLMGVFSGGDSLSISLKKKFDQFLEEHGSTVHVREGYGTTECVTASCLTPYNKEKEGSIGLPYPDTYYKICKVGTKTEVPYGEDGEICLSGPSVMMGYINNEEENKKTLQTHRDGKVWLHTGDLGSMDKEGFIYFKQRIKRMIITSGYNVYPSQIENVIDSHPAVQLSCVIGVKDNYKMQRVKAFVVLKRDYEPSEEMKKAILEYCSKSIAKYAMPKEIEFREDLPKTLVGKVAYSKLENETK